MLRVVCGVGGGGDGEGAVCAEEGVMGGGGWRSGLGEWGGK